MNLSVQCYVCRRYALIMSVYLLSIRYCMLFVYAYSCVVCLLNGLYVLLCVMSEYVCACVLTIMYVLAGVMSCAVGRYLLGACVCLVDIVRVVIHFCVMCVCL